MDQVSNTSDTEIHVNDLNQTRQQFPLSYSLFALARSHRALAAQLLREIDLFPGQELLLMQLFQQDRQSQNRLSQTLHLDHSTVAKSVKRLEDVGLVTRRRSPQDGRVTLVSLTEAGRKLESSVLNTWHKMESISSNGFTEHEKTLLLELSNKVTHGILKYEEASTMSESRMQAIVVHQYGSPEVLKLEEVDRPNPLAGEVLVKIHYAAVVPIDWKIRNGWMQAAFPKSLPYILGFYASGIVESVGPGVTEFTVGTRVFGFVNGAYAEYGIAPVNELVKMPEGLSFEDAASIKAGADTAWKVLFTEGELEAGQTVLIHAAAGGVGQFAVQLAKWKGAHVIGTASTSNLDFVKSLGTDQVIDYTTTAFEDVVKNVDLVVDSVGGETENRSWAVLKQGGILVSLTQPPSQENAQKHGITAKFNTKFPTYSNLQTIAQLIADGTIKAKIDSIFPLSEAKKAQEKSEARHGRGRILLRINSF